MRSDSDCGTVLHRQLQDTTENIQLNSLSCRLYHGLKFEVTPLTLIHIQIYLDPWAPISFFRKQLKRHHTMYIVSAVSHFTEFSKNSMCHVTRQSAIQADSHSQSVSQLVTQACSLFRTTTSLTDTPSVFTFHTIYKYIRETLRIQYVPVFE